MDYSDSRMLIYAVFLLSIAIGTTGGALVSGPTNQNVTVGQQVILDCATDLKLPVYWYFKGNEIFYGGKVAMSFQDRFNVSSKNKGEYNLVISSADIWHSGEYICGDDEGEGERKSAHLYVTGEAVTVPVDVNQGASNNGNVSSGIIIGLVVGGIVLILAIITAVAVYFCKKPAISKNKLPPDDPEAGGIQSEGESGATEVLRREEIKPLLQGEPGTEAAQGEIDETHTLPDSGAKETVNTNIDRTPYRTVPAPAARSKDVPKFNEDSGAKETVNTNIDRTPYHTAGSATEAVNSNIDTTATSKAGSATETVNSNIDTTATSKAGSATEAVNSNIDTTATSKVADLVKRFHENKQQPEVDLQCHNEDPKNQSKSTATHELEQKATAAAMAEAKSMNDSQTSVLHTPKDDQLMETSQKRATPRLALKPGNDPPPATSGTTGAQPQRTLGNTAVDKHPITTLRTDDEKLVDDP